MKWFDDDRWQFDDGGRTLFLSHSECMRFETSKSRANIAHLSRWRFSRNSMSLTPFGLFRVFGNLSVSSISSPSPKWTPSPLISPCSAIIVVGDAIGLLSFDTISKSFSVPPLDEVSFAESTVNIFLEIGPDSVTAAVGGVCDVSSAVATSQLFDSSRMLSSLLLLPLLFNVNNCFSDLCNYMWKHITY